MAETPQKVQIEYSRNKGFKTLDELQSAVSQEAFDMVKAQANLMEKDARLREVTQKVVIRVVLIISLIVLIILLVLANLLSALICFGILVALAYFLAFVQAKKLKKLAVEYALKITGSDWDYFGVRLEHKFGNKKWKFYAFLPFIKPTIALIIHILRKPEPNQPKLSLQVTDKASGLDSVQRQSSNIPTPLFKPPPAIQDGMTSKEMGLPSITKGSKPLGAKTLTKEVRRSSIELGNHDESADLGKRLEKQKLFE